ncbi:MAG: hypothetical protein WC856_07935 [Methylococcaceae bacterium]|jgi:hypothetical protein
MNNNDISKAPKVGGSELTGLLGCPCCGKNAAERQRDDNIFAGQIYSDRYPASVAKQRHGFRVRCAVCGVQTCWWHYQQEAAESWNTRPNAKLSGALD